MATFGKIGAVASRLTLMICAAVFTALSTSTVGTLNPDSTWLLTWLLTSLVRLLTIFARAGVAACVGLAAVMAAVVVESRTAARLPVIQHPCRPQSRPGP